MGRQTFINQDNDQRTFIDPDNNIDPRGGYKSYNYGKSFEDIIKNVNDYYFKNDLAYIQKFDHPKLYLKDKNMVVYTTKATIDFVGVVYSSGRAIFIECKSTWKGNIPIGNDKTGIKNKQIEILTKLVSHNCDAYILWFIRNDNKLYKIHPSYINELIQKGKKSISLIDLSQYRIPIVVPKMIKGKLYYDYLNLI